MTSPSSFDQNADDVEELLVLAEFAGAAASARALLHETFYAAGSSEVRQRALAVLLQALYELGRFEDALPELRDLVGGPSRWGSRPLLLWVALSLEAQPAQATEQLLEDFIQSSNFGEAGWSTEELATVCQIYVAEVMPAAGKTGPAILSWLDSHATLLPPCNMAAIRQLVADRFSPGDPALAPADTSHTSVQPDPAHKPSVTSPPGVPKSQRQPESEQEEGSTTQQAAMALAAHKASPPPVVVGPAACVAPPAAAARAHAKGSVPGSAMAQQPSWDVWSCGQAAVAAGCAALTLYAAFAERRAIRRLATNVASQIKSGVTDLLVSGLNFNPNPVASRHFGRLPR